MRLVVNLAPTSVVGMPLNLRRELRKATIEMIRRLPHALIHLALKPDPGRLQGRVVKQSARKHHRKHTQTATGAAHRKRTTEVITQPADGFVE